MRGAKGRFSGGNKSGKTSGGLLKKSGGEGGEGEDPETGLEMR